MTRENTISEPDHAAFFPDAYEKPGGDIGFRLFEDQPPYRAELEADTSGAVAPSLEVMKTDKTASEARLEGDAEKDADTKGKDERMAKKESATGTESDSAAPDEVVLVLLLLLLLVYCEPGPLARLCDLVSPRQCVSLSAACQHGCKKHMPTKFRRSGCHC